MKKWQLKKKKSSLLVSAKRRCAIRNNTTHVQISRAPTQKVQRTEVYWLMEVCDLGYSSHLSREKFIFKRNHSQSCCSTTFRTKSKGWIEPPRPATRTQCSRKKPFAPSLMEHNVLKALKSWKSATFKFKSQPRLMKNRCITHYLMSYKLRD